MGDFRAGWLVACTAYRVNGGFGTKDANESTGRVGGGFGDLRGTGPSLRYQWGSRSKHGVCRYGPCYPYPQSLAHSTSSTAQHYQQASPDDDIIKFIVAGRFLYAGFFEGRRGQGSTGSWSFSTNTPASSLFHRRRLAGTDANNQDMTAASQQGLPSS